MTEPRSLRARIKKCLAWALMLGLAALFIFGFANKPQLPSEIVLKQNFIAEQSIYIVQDARNPDEPKNLRFYVDNGNDRNNQAMTVRLGKKPPLPDTDLNDGVIHPLANGLHIHREAQQHDSEDQTENQEALAMAETGDQFAGGRWRLGGG